MELFNRIVRLCILKTAPQDIPESQLLLVVGALLNAGVTLHLLPDKMDIVSGLLLVVTDLLIFAGMIYFALVLRGLRNRFNQTLTANLWSGALLSVLLVLIHALRMSPLLDLVILVWFILVCGHIMRHALSAPMSAGVGFAILYMFLSYTIVGLLFPELAGKQG